jgi:putative thioredoxin
MATVATHIIEVNERTFVTEVLERSRTVPVVVDFWAEWCGPCHMLGPTLERLATEYNGAFVLAKVDVDQNPNLARQFGIQGIPAVKAFRNHQMVNEFTGALPEPQVRRFLETLIPSPADIYTQEGQALEAQGQTAPAIEKYRAALAEKADHYPALLGLGRALMQEEQFDEAVSTLEKIPPGVSERSAADALLANLQFQKYAAGHNEAELGAKLEADPADTPSRYALASLLALKNQPEAAMDQFLEVIRRDRQYNDDGARKAILALLTTLGENHPDTAVYRQKLANALF